MFEKSRKILIQLLDRKEQMEKDLPLAAKIQLAEDCLKEVKDKKEYMEIEQILEGLQKEYKYMKKGFKKTREFMSTEEAEQIVREVNQEINVAVGTYEKLKKEADDLESNFKKQMDTLKSEIKAIEDQYTFAARINSYLPHGIELELRKIPLKNWGIGLKENPSSNNPTVMGMWKSKGITPIQEAADQIQELGRTRRPRR